MPTWYRRVEGRVFDRPRAQRAVANSK